MPEATNTVSLSKDSLIANWIEGYSVGTLIIQGGAVRTTSENVALVYMGWSNLYCVWKESFE